MVPMDRTAHRPLCRRLFPPRGFPLGVSAKRVLPPAHSRFHWFLKPSQIRQSSRRLAADRRPPPRPPWGGRRGPLRSLRALQPARRMALPGHGLSSCPWLFSATSMEWLFSQCHTPPPCRASTFWRRTVAARPTNEKRKGGRPSARFPAVRVLALESSCDETACAIVEATHEYGHPQHSLRVRASVIASQVPSRAGCFWASCRSHWERKACCSWRRQRRF